VAKFKEAFLGKTITNQIIFLAKLRADYIQEILAATMFTIFIFPFNFLHGKESSL
jgi:hypothetical protein